MIIATGKTPVAKLVPLKSASKKRIPGRLKGKIRVSPEFFDPMTEGFVELPIFARPATRAGLLTGPHQDPFDRMLAAQALAGNIPLIGRDTHFDHFAIQRIW